MKAKALILFLFFCLALIRSASAELGEEMRILNMFYEEKDLVVSSTRQPKHIFDSAENITVITLKEIEAMNAHTVGEVLSRVPGLFVNSNRDFGATTLINAQGVSARHVQILLDGIPWNFNFNETAETNTIPIGIVERIEVVKGPASSVWGPYLGGAVNIITKDVGNCAVPSGSISASYGNSRSGDYRAEIRGAAGTTGYYLFAGHQASDGLVSGRSFDNDGFFAKIHAPVTDRLSLGASLGYSDPDADLGDYPAYGFSSNYWSRALWGKGYLRGEITESLSLHASAYKLTRKHASENLELGNGGSLGDLLLSTDSEEDFSGANIEFSWKPANHSVVTGAEYIRGDFDSRLRTGEYYQFLGAHPVSLDQSAETRQSFYINDTILLGRFSLTPGLRYDHSSLGDENLSPSFGVTCKLPENTLLRASIARGFSLPPISLKKTGGLFLDPNPDLDSESIWSYQIGMETAQKYFWLKATLFYHEIEDGLVKIYYGGESPANNDIYVNGSSADQKGFEIEWETVPVWNLSLKAGYSYVHYSPADIESGAENAHTADICLKYDDNQGLNIQLMGSLVDWGLPADRPSEDGEFIWDLVFSKRLPGFRRILPEVFGAVHNLLNQDQYLFPEQKNPDRWMEAGIRIRF